MNRVLAVTLALVMLTACTSTAKTTIGTTQPANPTSASAAQAQIGDTVTATDSGASVQITVTNLHAVTKPSEFYTPAGTVYSVDVTINCTSGSFSANPLEFTARTAAGDSSEAALGAVDNQIETTDVAAGQRLRGAVAFDMPKGSKPALIVLSGPLGDQIATWHA